MKERRMGDCIICGTTTRTLGFRLFICKSCAMFYRRTYRIREQLRCIGTGNCPLSGAHRSTCRFCRMRACRDAGLRMVGSSLVVQHGGYPEDDVFEEPHPDPPRQSPPAAAPPPPSSYAPPPQPPPQQQQPPQQHQIPNGGFPVSQYSQMPPRQPMPPVSSVNFTTASSVPSASLIHASYPIGPAGYMPANAFPAPNGGQYGYNPQYPPPAVSYTAPQDVFFRTTLGSTESPPRSMTKTDQPPQIDTPPSTASTVAPTPPTPSNPICPLIDVDSLSAEKYPHLHNVARIYHRFEKRQAALVDSFRNEDEVGISQSILIENIRYLQIESGSLHLLSLMIGGILKAAGDVPTRNWPRVFRSCVVQMSLVHKLCLGVRQFPKRGDPRLASFIGGHADSSDLKGHLGPNWEQRRVCYNLIEPMWKVWYESMEKFREVAPSAAESVVLVMVFVMEELARHDFLTEEGVQYRDAVYIEFNSYLTELHGAAAAASRLVRLVSLILDAKKLEIAYDEMWSLVRVFRPEFCEYTWHEKIRAEDDEFLNQYQRIAEELSEEKY